MMMGTRDLLGIETASDLVEVVVEVAEGVGDVLDGNCNVIVGGG
jgi:hypothetical protein